MNQETIRKAINGYLMILVFFLLLGIGVLIIFSNFFILAGLSFFLAFMVLPGFTILNPNESTVLTLFGKYKGTMKENGFWWFNPFMAKKKISLRARNFNSEPLKVNDKIGNPIMIGAVVVWKVNNTYKAAFDVDNYEHFVVIQTEAAIRKLAGIYPYDNFEDEDAKLTLRDGGEQVNKQLEQEIADRLTIAGIQILEARINYLAYATEIASAMLKRQQAVAIIAARTKIVEGAVSMVEMAIDQLTNKSIVKLNETSKAQLVSNLMVVLTSDKDVTPVVNTTSNPS